MFTLYKPANLNSQGDLDIQSLKCASYASVLSFGDVPTDPNRWMYGIELRGKMHKKVWIAAEDIILVGFRDYQDDKADVILKYLPDETRLLKAYGELPDNTRLNEGIALATGLDYDDDGPAVDYIEFED